MQINQEIRKIPFFRLIIPFIIGILLQLTFNYDKKILLYSFFAFTVILISYSIITDKNPNYHRR